MSRRAPWLLLCAGLVLLAPAARSEDAGTEACLAAHTDGQKARRAGKLSLAKQKFQACAAAACPDIVKQQCVPWLADIDQRIPTIVLDVRDSNGRDLADVRVLLDGAPLTERLDGRSLPLDPGMHTFRFEAKGYRSVERGFILRESEQGRVLKVSLFEERVGRTPKPLPKSSPERAGVPLGAVILGGVGLAALGGGSYFFFKGKSDVSNLRDSCAPNCDDADVSSARTKIRVADVLLGTGVVALGVATFLALGAGSSRESNASYAPSLSR